MVKERVVIEIHDKGYVGKALVNVDALTNQPEIEGTLDISELSESDQLLADQAIYSDNNGTSHRLRLTGTNGAYVFRMKSKSSLEFTAVRADINPATGKPLL